MHKYNYKLLKMKHITVTSRKLQGIRRKSIISISLLLWTYPAYAYLDPGTSSMLLQGLIALVAGIVTGVKVYFSCIRAFFGRLFSSRSKADSDAKSTK